MELSIAMRFLQDDLAEISEKVKACRDLYEEEGLTDHDKLTALESLQRAIEENLKQLQSVTEVEEDRYNIVKFLNKALKLEYNGIFDYNLHASAMQDKALAERLKDFGASEIKHARYVADLIRKFGGEPRFNPPEARQDEKMTVQEMLQAHLKAEKKAIELFEDGLARFSEPEFAWVIGNLKMDEQQHAKEVEAMLQEYEKADMMIEIKRRWRDDYSGDDEDRPWIDG